MRPKTLTKTTLRNTSGSCQGLAPSNGKTRYRPQGDEFGRLKDCYDRGKHVLPKGPPGCGRSMLAVEFLNGLGVPYECVDPGDIKEPKDLLGRYIAGPQGSIPVEYQLLRAARNGSPLFLDEIGSLPANVLLSFNSVTDSQRRLTVFGEVVTAAPGFWILGTYNPPARIFSPALRERFRFIPIGYLPPDDEK